MRYHVVAQRSDSSALLLATEDPATADLDTLEVIHYYPATQRAWKPKPLQSYLKHGWWEDPKDVVLNAGPEAGPDMVPTPAPTAVDVTVSDWHDDEWARELGPSAPEEAAALGTV